MTRALGLLLVSAVLASPQSYMKEVVYEVDGTAKYANLTLTTKDGGTEQNQVKLPFELKFFAKLGQPVYLSAQKVKVTRTMLSTPEILDDGVSGKVHVLIRISGSLLQEATSDAPYGIATARGIVPE